MNEFIKKAKLEYEELESFVSNFKSDFEDLCKELGGFNIAEEYFDINYKSFTTTIYYKENKIIISDYIDIWNDANCEHIESGFNIKQYKGGL